MIKVGILGASGYMGGEVLRVLLEHPEATVAWATSRTPRDAEECHRNLVDCGVKLISPDEITPCDTVFIALPGGQAMEMAPRLIQSGSKVIDLGADFRLQDRETWERLYGKKHTAWELVEEAVYGTTELRRTEVQRARLIANPGCFSSAVIYGLAPLVREHLIDTESIFVNGLSGTTGAGQETDPALHHPELHNNVLAYNVVDHRHTYEMEQELGRLTPKRVVVHFTPVYVPISRGILAICHARPLNQVSRANLLELFRDFYGSAKFIKVLDFPKDPKVSWQYKPYPFVSAVSASNYCHIGLDVDERRGRIVVFSVLDSVGKGGAHAAVQNMNLLFGLPEELGVARYGWHPF